MSKINSSLFPKLHKNISMAWKRATVAYQVFSREFINVQENCLIGLGIALKSLDALFSIEIGKLEWVAPRTGSTNIDILRV